MRHIYKYSKADSSVVACEVATSGNHTTYKDMKVSDAEALVDNGEARLHETQEVLNTAIDYQRVRREKYPDTGEQLDQIYHEGIDAWKATVKAVKDAYPKP